MNLNREHFRTISEKDGYIITRTETPHAVLFSKKTGQPLASLAIRCQKKQENNTQPGRTVLAHLGDDDDSCQRVQCVIDTDGQAFEFVISNLLTGNYSDNKKYINFNLLRTDRHRKDISLRGINQINTLRSGESCVVKSDCQNENRTLILSTITDPNSGESMTIREDEQKAEKHEKKTEGSYIFISVLPASNSDVAELFGDSVWKVTDYFVTKRDVPNNTKHLMRNSASLMRGIPRTYGTRYNSYKRDLLLGEVDDLESGDTDDELDDESDGNEFYFNSFKSSNVNETMRARACGLTPPIQQSRTRQDLFNSKASKINYGDVVQVQSTSVDIVFDLDNRSAPCVVGLSVMEDLKFMENLSDAGICELAESLIKSLIDHSKNEADRKFIEFIQTKTYSSEECCICFDGVPNTVFYTCGHRAVEYKCLKQDLNNCPLCRTYITAYLCINDKNANNSQVPQSVKQKTQQIVIDPDST